MKEILKNIENALFGLIRKFSAHHALIRKFSAHHALFQKNMSAALFALIIYKMSAAHVALTKLWAPLTKGLRIGLTFLIPGNSLNFFPKRETLNASAPHPFTTNLLLTNSCHPSKGRDKFILRPKFLRESLTRCQKQHVNKLLFNFNRFYMHVFKN